MYVIEREELKTKEKSWLHKPAQWCYDYAKSAKFKTKKSAQKYMDDNYLMFSKKQHNYTINAA